MMKKCQKHLFVTLMIAAFACCSLINCGGDDTPLGKVSITLTASDQFKAPNTDESGATTKVIWGCLVLDDTTTACMYYYNGEMQTDSKMSTEAISAGPGSSGFTFVAPGTKFSDIEGGIRIYSHYVGYFDNNTGQYIDTPVQLSGEFDLYANIGEDIDWIIGFGSGAHPTSNTQ